MKVEINKVKIPYDIKWRISSRRPYRHDYGPSLKITTHLQDNCRTSLLGYGEEDAPLPITFCLKTLSLRLFIIQK